MPEDNEIVHTHLNINATPATEADIAASLKNNLRFELDRICLQMDRASAAGFDPQFNLDIGQTGKWTITDLVVMKRY